MTDHRLAALRHRDFVLFSVSRFLSTGSMMLQQAAIAWQVYQISGSALQLGILGLVRFLPSVAMTLLGGSMADTYSRRRIVLLAQAAALCCSLGLFLTSAGGVAGLATIYALVLILGLASAFENPARQALLPLLVPREEFANAVTVDRKSVV